MNALDIVSEQQLPVAGANRRYSDAEWAVRVDLAAAYQLAAHYRWADLIYTHFSARVPGTEHILINPFGLMFDEITASSLIKIALDGTILDDSTGMGVNQAGYVIHSCIHAARPDLQCIMHTHSRAGAAVSAMKCGLLPISQHAMRVQRHIAYHDYEGVALELDEQARLVRDLGPDAVSMILRNHGLLSAGPSVRSAFNVMYFLECACQIQVDALAGGMANVLFMSEEAASTADRQFHEAQRYSQGRDWQALLRILARRRSDYAT